MTARPTLQGPSMSVNQRTTSQRGRGGRRRVPLNALQATSPSSHRPPNQSRQGALGASEPEAVNSQTSRASYFEASENVDIQGGSFNAGGQHINVTINAHHPHAENEVASESRNVSPLPVLRYPQVNYNTRDPLPIQRSCDIYFRHMSVKGRGSPLWIPQANNQLPVEYRRKGIEIGDIGIITASGSFDFLFNIFLPADHPLQPEVLPQGFRPSEPFRAIDIHIQEEFDENSYLASFSIQRAQHDTDLIGLSFESSESEGAILTMPHGLNSKELSNVALGKQYMQDHIENIYRYVNGNLGREVKNGDVRLVIGLDKTTAWGMATFVRSTSQQSLRLKFKPMTRGSLGRTYGWEYSGMAEVRSGPGTREVEQLRLHPDSNPFEHENQCLFIRTLNGTLGADVWNRLESSKFRILDVHESSDSSHNTKMRETTNTDPSRSTDNSQKHSINTDLNTSAWSRSNELESVRSSEIDVAQALHPSRNINEYLLSQNPNARVAITVDNDWISVVNKNDSVLPPTDIMLKRILASHEIKGEDDVVYLLPKHSVRASSQSTYHHMISPYKPSTEDYFNGSSSRLLRTPSVTPKPKPTGRSVERALNNDESSLYRQSGISKPTSISFKSTFRWIKGDLIGEGSHGKVYLAFNASTGEIMAVKQVEVSATASDRSKPSLTNLVEALRSERETLRDLDHENIVQHLGFEEQPKIINIFLQYVSGSSIGACLRKTGRFREEVTKDFTRQILQGLAYLHSRGILHRDMKGDNILVDDTGVCKISNFGILKRREVMDHARTHMKGASYWIAPEVFARGPNGYDTKVDIWSLGCVVFEMWTAKRPWFDQVDIRTMMIKLMERKIIPSLPEDLQLSHFAEHFRQECFNYDPEKRPTAEFLLKHPYIDLPPEWNFPGMSDMSEPVPPRPTAEDAAQIIQNTVHSRVGAPSYRRSVSPALTMNSNSSSSSLNAPVVVPPRPKSPPLVIIPLPPPRKLPSPERAVDRVVRGSISPVISESSTSQESSQQSATTRSKRLAIHNPDTVPDFTKSQGRPLSETRKALPLPRSRFADLASSIKSGNASSPSGNARVQQYVSAAPLSTQSLPHRFGPASMQEIVASRSNAQEIESEDGSDCNSDVTSSTWQISSSRRQSLPTTVDSESLFDLPFDFDS